MLTVNKNKARVEEIKQALDDKRKGRGAGSTEQQAIKSKLSELRGQFQALLVGLSFKYIAFEGITGHLTTTPVS